MSQTVAHLHILQGLFLFQPKDGGGSQVCLRGELCDQQFLPWIQSIIWFAERLLGGIICSYLQLPLCLLVAKCFHSK